MSGGGSGPDWEKQWRARLRKEHAVMVSAPAPSHDWVAMGRAELGEIRATRAKVTSFSADNMWVIKRDEHPARQPAPAASGLTAELSRGVPYEEYRFSGSEPKPKIDVQSAQKPNLPPRSRLDPCLLPWEPLALEVARSRVHTLEMPPTPQRPTLPHARVVSASADAWSRGEAPLSQWDLRPRGDGTGAGAGATRGKPSGEALAALLKASGRSMVAGRPRRRPSPA